MWEVLMEMERVNGKEKIKELRLWSLTWRRHSSESAFQWSGLGDAFQLSKEDLAGAVRLF